MDYNTIAIVSIIIIVGLLYLSLTNNSHGTIAFQKTKGDMVTTLYIFSAPCDRKKYTMYGNERNMKTNKGTDYINDYYDESTYFTSNGRDELVSELINDGWKQVYEIVNSDGRRIKIDDIKIHNDLDTKKCR
jgi:hypothetical protein